MRTSFSFCPPHRWRRPRCALLTYGSCGTPHVLQGDRLCLYLDPTREWDPAAGITPVINRLWQWLTDAAAGTFDPATALYHPVGGVLHHTPGTPTVVVREPVSHRPATAWLTPRTTDRLDLTNVPTESHSHRTPILPVDTLPLGAGSTLAELLTLAHPDMAPDPTAADTAPPALLTALAASALRNPEGTAQHFVLAVRHPATPAAPPSSSSAACHPRPPTRCAASPAARPPAAWAPCPTTWPTPPRLVLPLRRAPRSHHPS